ncbi:AraC family transcriptional regulator [Streptomyces sp. CS227]|uniref:GlxA family transcriptional regulator n=1 Tax=Streptomyces sp. CS227 TaxID=1982763 RepID=UPI000B41D77B|nr:DJ-1/PfpI family protein [Streptomyces sp. CS227]OWA18957.1 AraC family transcriptional regulator [Streptomyces sp. CS227]
MCRSARSTSARRHGLDISCPTGVFETATRWGAEPGYRVELVSLGGLAVRTSCGLALAADALERVGGRLDSVMVAGGPGHRNAAEDARLLVHLRRLAGHSRRAVSVCTGATLLAAAGLLDRRRATTHWAWAAELAARYPAVTVTPASLFVSDGKVHTSAGVTSAIDLTLPLVEQDHGPALAREVARLLVAYLQRPGNQAQVSMHAAAPPDHRLVPQVCEPITAHPDADLDAAALARFAGVSSRHLARLFAAELGTTPARHVRAVRAEAAAQLLAATNLPLTAIARRCALRTTETLRQAFADLFATTPSGYRGAARQG